MFMIRFFFSFINNFFIICFRNKLHLITVDAIYVKDFFWLVGVLGLYSSALYIFIWLVLSTDKFEKFILYEIWLNWNPVKVATKCLHTFFREIKGHILLFQVLPNIASNQLRQRFNREAIKLIKILKNAD